MTTPAAWPDRRHASTSRHQRGGATAVRRLSDYALGRLGVSSGVMLIEALTRASGQRKARRSQLVEEAVAVWQGQQLEQALIEGYQAMAKEDAETAEAHLAAGREPLV